MCNVHTKFIDQASARIIDLLSVLSLLFKYYPSANSLIMFINVYCLVVLYILMCIIFHIYILKMYIYSTLIFISRCLKILSFIFPCRVFYFFVNIFIYSG